MQQNAVSVWHHNVLQAALFSVCFSYGGQLAKVQEQNTNIYIGDQMNDADSTVKHYWIGMNIGLYIGVAGKLETVVVWYLA